MTVFALFGFVALVSAGPSSDAYKDQFCTDPRTMQKHQAYTEWADAYSCTRHRCQPGGRSLAIYTVGCKRVETPESAIECEEVVEDTNMQFPYCCVRLRCLVLVRGEVWTRVLGQPWETLPAAPWSHMYKMKKPPPGDTVLLPKVPREGPVYELSEAEGERDRVPRVNKMMGEEARCNNVASRAMPTPDIVIALSTDNDGKNKENERKTRNKRPREPEPYYEDLAQVEGVHDETENEDPYEDEKVTSNQWNEKENQEIMRQDEAVLEETDQGGFPPIYEETPLEDKPTNLQDLVDAIGNRMRDIEHVVQRMSEKVNQEIPDASSVEKRSIDNVSPLQPLHKRNKVNRKRPYTDNHYKRGTQYVHVTASPTEQPLFIEDTSGYYSDDSALLRRDNQPKEPRVTYMAPVDARRQSTHILTAGLSEEKIHKKHSHKRKNGKGKNHRKHHKEDKNKRFNKISSVELDKNIISLEDSSALASR